MTRHPFKVPRRPAARPFHETAERDDDDVEFESTFVTRLAAETAPAPVQITRGPYMTALLTGSPLPTLPASLDDDDLPPYMTSPEGIPRHIIDAPVRLYTRKK